MADNGEGAAGRGADADRTDTRTDAAGPDVTPDAGTGTGTGTGAGGSGGGAGDPLERAVVRETLALAAEADGGDVHDATVGVDWSPADAADADPADADYRIDTRPDGGVHVRVTVTVEAPVVAPTERFLAGRDTTVDAVDVDVVVKRVVGSGGGVVAVLGQPRTP